MSPLLCVALSAFLWPRAAFPALPPASTGSSPRSSDAAAAAEPSRAGQPAGGGGLGLSWVLPEVRIGGSLSYDIRSSSGEGQNMSQRGMMASLRAATNSYIWQPWFAQVDGNLGVSTTRNSTGGEFSGKTRTLALTGHGQLRLLPVSRFPFEAHFEKTDNRMSDELVSVEGYSGQRFGFSQQHIRAGGDAMFGWDRAMQESERSGRDRQDSMRFSASHHLEKQRFSFNGDRSRNVRERTGESATMSNLTVQHSFTPAAAVSIENMGNVSRSDYRLRGGDSRTELAQLSSLAFWRPLDMPLTVTGGARLLGMGAESGASEFGPALESRLRNANLNLGLTYDLSRAVQLNASANVNMNEANGQRTVSGNQSAGAGYRPDSKKIGRFDYNWGASAMINNASGSNTAGSHLTMQLSHSLMRSVALGAAGALSFEANQGFSGTTMIDGAESASSASRHVTHGGAVSWSRYQDGGSALVRLSASDSRALDADKTYFQLINFQASSNVPTGGYTSWSGSLTIQAVRQGGRSIPGTSLSGGTVIEARRDNSFVTTSSGSVTYQNSRFLGMRRLRFVSDLRLNSQALLPMLGGPQDQEMAAWQNRLDYSIGRMQFRVNTLLAQITAPAGDNQSGESRTKLNKSIMFSVTRTFGNL